MAQFRVQLKDPGGLARVAGEAAFGWADNEVVFASGASLMIPVPVDRNGAAQFTWNDPAPMTMTDARRRVRNVPGTWRVVGEKSSILALSPDKTRGAIVSARQRLTLYTGFANFVSRVAIATGRDGEPPTAQAFETYLRKMCPGLDDLSLVATFVPDLKNGAKWDPRFALFGKSIEQSPDQPGSVLSTVRNLVEACHAAGIQIVAGYEIRDDFSAQTQGDFVAWLSSGKTDMVRHAEALANEVKRVQFDGVVFDIEVNGIGPKIEDPVKLEQYVKARASSSNPDAQKEERAARNLATLYQHLADQLVTSGGFVSYATASFVDYGAATLKDGVYRFGHTRVQPLGITRGRPNLVARIMAYDDGPQATGGANDALAARHRAILEGVIGGGIHPSTIQLGCKMLSAKELGQQTGHMTVAQVEERCRTLRLYRTGVFTFSFSSRNGPPLADGGEEQADSERYQKSRPNDEVAGFYRYDRALNPYESPRDAFDGVPFQAPHASVRLRPPGGRQG